MANTLDINDRGNYCDVSVVLGVSTGFLICYGLYSQTAQ